MPKKILNLLLGVSSFLAITAGLSRCSLNTYPVQLTLRIDPTSLQSRSGPAISDFQYFALSVSGALANSLSTTDVGKRDLSCLYLDGLVTFPLTYAQLTQTGVSLSLSSGSYTISVLGFHKSPLSGATSISQLMAAATLPEEYLLAQATINTASSNTIAMTASYSGATPNRLPSCAPNTSPINLFEIYSGVAGNPGGSVSFNSIEGGYPPKSYLASPMQLISSLPATHSLAPGASNHANISPVFSGSPSGHFANDTLVFEVVGSAGLTAWDGTNCGSSILTAGDYSIAVWNFNLSTWETGGVVTNGSTVTQTLSPITPNNFLSNGKIVTTIRSNPHNRRVPGCVALKVDSVSFAFTFGGGA